MSQCLEMLISDIGKFVMVTVNLAVMIISAGMVTLGIILRHYLDTFLSRAGGTVFLDNLAADALNNVLLNAAEEDSYSEIAGKAGLMLILLGVFLFGVCFCGCMGACLDHVTMLKVFTVANLLLLVLEIALLVMLFSTEYKIADQLRTHLLDKIKNKYSPDGVESFSQVLDTAMNVSKCCGINGPKDFESVKNMTFNNGDGNIVPVKVPPICCKHSDQNQSAGGVGTDLNPVGYSAAVMECAMKGDKGGMSPVTKGCFEQFFNLINTFMKTIYAILIATICLQVFEIVMSIYYIRNK